MWASIEFALLNSVLSLVEENYIVNLNFVIPLMDMSNYSHRGYNLKLISDLNASLFSQNILQFVGNALSTTADVKHHNSRLHNPSIYY